MRTHAECLPCFVKQAEATARLCTADPDDLRRVVDEVTRLVSRLDPSLSPPENAVAVYKKIAEITGVDDPYSGLKRKGNAFATELRDQVRLQIGQADDQLAVAVRFAIAANIIDYGSCHTFDALAVMESCLTKELVIDDFGLLQRAIAGPGERSVLYLADNCGEIVFDGLLVEQMQQQGCRVIMAVRGDTILNDAILPDATLCGIDSICRVITNGTGCPGTPLGSCSKELQDAFAAADIIISKGQGNFETLSEVKAPVFYLLTVKCPVVARHVTAIKGLGVGTLQGQGEMVLMQGGCQ